MSDEPTPRFFVTGASGFIGSHLLMALARSGHRVTGVTRTPARAAKQFSRLGEASKLIEFHPYQPAEAHHWASGLEGHDVVVNLAGEQAVGTRWTRATKDRILKSRVETTELLVSAIGCSTRRARVLISASGVDYYAAHPRGIEITEQHQRGTGFLSAVTEAWESAARKAETLGVRVVIARFGIVFARDGGALQQMVKPFQLGLGGPIGSGRQLVSWVHLDDVIRAVSFVAGRGDIAGPVNIVAPDAVTNAELAGAIGRVLRRPSWLKTPAFAIELAFGEGAQPILIGRQAVPGVLTRAGFEFRYPELSSALEQALT